MHSRTLTENKYFHRPQASAAYRSLCDRFHDGEGGNVAEEQEPGTTDAQNILDYGLQPASSDPKLGRGQSPGARHVSKPSPGVTTHTGQVQTYREVPIH